VYELLQLFTVVLQVWVPGLLKKGEGFK